MSTLVHEPPADYAEYLARAAASPFPPSCWQDVRAYRHHEVMAGHQSRTRGDPAPDASFSSSHRWGWAQADRALRKKDDGFDLIRDRLRVHLESQRA